MHRVTGHPEIGTPSLTDDDLHLALYLCYELHYTALEGVDPAWKWEPSLLEFRRAMEDAFEKELTVTVPAAASESDIASTLATLAEGDSGRSLGRYLEREPLPRALQRVRSASLGLPAERGRSSFVGHPTIGRKG